MAAVSGPSPSSLPVAPVSGNAAPLVLHAAPISDVVIHAQPIGALRLTYTNSNGQTYPVLKKPTPEQQAHLEDLAQKLNLTNDPDFRFNVSQLVAERSDGTVSGNYSEKNPHVRELRVLIQEIYGDTHVSWKKYPEDCRRSPDAPHPAHLEKMAFTEDHLRASLQSRPLTTDAPVTEPEKLERLKHYRVMESVLAAVKKTRKELADSVPDNTPQEKLTKKLREYKLKEMGTVLEQVDEPALLFEATHRIDPNGALSGAQKKQALARKQAQAKAWVDACRGAEKHRDAQIETQYVHDLLLLQTGSRDEYVQTAHLVGATERREGIEAFYAQLADAVASGDQVKIRNIVGDKVFGELLFGSLHELDKSRMEDQLLTEMVAVSEKFKTANFQQDLREVFEIKPNASDSYLGQLFRR